MISRTSGLFLLAVMVLLGSYLTGCGGKDAKENQKVSTEIQKDVKENKKDAKEDQTDTADSKEVTVTIGGRSVVIHSDTLRINYEVLVKIFSCLKKCPECGIVPCDPACDSLCNDFKFEGEDRSYIAESEALSPIPRILKVSQAAIDLQRLINLKLSVSGKASLDYNVMLVELHYMISTLDIIYKKSLLKLKK